MKYIVLILSFICFQSIYGQKDIKYKYEERPVLTWDDFKGSPILDSPFHANTNSGFAYSWSYSTSNGVQELEYEVYSTFYPFSSWVHPNHKVDHLLAHEQLHFDISELHARKLRKAMRSYKPGRSIRNDLKKIYNTIESERVEMQKRFDAESNHSKDKEKEAKWQSYIKSELDRLSDFSTS